MVGGRFGKGSDDQLDRDLKVPSPVLGEVSYPVVAVDKAGWFSRAQL